MKYDRVMLSARCLLLVLSAGLSVTVVDSFTTSPRSHQLLIPKVQNELPVRCRLVKKSNRNKVAESWRSACRERLTQTRLNSHLQSFNPTLAVSSLVASATTKFIAKWRTYCLVPLTAAIVGYVTNWLAVKMSEYSSACDPI